MDTLPSSKLKIALTFFLHHFAMNLNIGLVRWEKFGGIWMVLDESGEICERKTQFRMKKEANQAGFKGTRTGPQSVNPINNTAAFVEYSITLPQMD